MADLESWTDSASRAAIVTFVEGLTIPPAERVAVFDNDGTLWCEKPMPIVLDFLVRRFAEMAAADPSLGAKQPYPAAITRDLSWLGQAMIKHYHGDDADMALLIDAVDHAFAGVSIGDYAQRVKTFFASASHPSLDRPYLECGYQPMIELMRYLEANGFATYIASGSDRDFMRPAAVSMYAIPPERVIGSAVEMSYVDAGADIVYTDHLDVLDDGPAKPVRIWSRIGRRPTIAVGNSNGDLPMLRFAGGADSPALRILIDHDDGDREFAYAAGAEDALKAARGEDWTVVSMADDWTTIFG